MPSDSPPLPLASIALADMAQITYAWNDLAETERLLGESLRIDTFWKRDSGTLDSCLLMARLCHLRGDTPGVETWCARARETANVTHAEIARSYIDGACASYRAAAGDPEAVEAWRRAWGVDPAETITHTNVVQQALLAELLARQGQHAPALALAERLEGYAIRTDWGQLRLEMLVRQALAQAALGACEAALAALRQALALAEPGGHVRLFLDEGVPMAALLRRLADDDPSPYLLRLLIAFDAAPAAPAPCGDLPEPVTDREREVLARIAAGQSNQAIADAMGVSLSTIKTHINHLYRKLDVATRTQALVKARELGLLSKQA